MIQWSDQVDIYLHRDPVDFSKSINGLAVIVVECMPLQACSGALFVFCNKGRDKLKALYWDKTGFALWYKRLEKERFKWPRKSRDQTLIISPEEWDWLLRGFDITKLQPHQLLFYQANR